VKPFYWRMLQQYFEPLNPIPQEPGFLKLEKENYDDDGKLRDLWFYGISAKRYCLFILNKHDDPIPVKWSSHGLGQLKHEHADEWERRLWANILQYEHGKKAKQQLLGEYENEFAIAELSITTPNLLQRVKAINQGKPHDRQIKPYNFILVGSPTMTSENDRPIIPITQFTSDYTLAPFHPFTDAKTGDLYEEATHLHWKTLDKMVEEYMDHPESKFQNGNAIGKLRRRHVKVDSIVHIGKETNELEETEILGLDDDAYVQYLPDKRH
jgi:hypothetical protein